MADFVLTTALDLAGARRGFAQLRRDAKGFAESTKRETKAADEGFAELTKATRAQTQSTTALQGAVEGLTEEMAKLRAEQEKNEDQNKNTGGSLRGVAKDMVAGATAGLALVASLVAVNQQLADLKNDLIDTSTRTGIAVSTLQGLRLAAEGSGLGFDQLGELLNALPLRLAEAATGAGRTADAFTGLGVSVTDSQGILRSSDAVLRDTLQALAKIEDPTLRAAAAQATLGEQGARLLQALGNPAALDHFVAQAGRFGLDVGPAAANAAGTWQRSVADLKLVLRGTADSVLDLDRAAGLLDDFVLGFVFASNFLIQRLKDMIGAFGDLGGVMRLVLAGEFKQAAETAARSLATLTFDGSNAVKVGLEAAASYREGRDALREAAGSSEDYAAAQALATSTTAGLTGALAEQGKALDALQTKLDTIARQAAEVDLADAFAAELGESSGRALAQLERQQQDLLRLRQEALQAGLDTAAIDQRIGQVQLEQVAITDQFADSWANLSTEAKAAGEALALQDLHDQQAALGAYNESLIEATDTTLQFTEAQLRVAQAGLGALNAAFSDFARRRVEEDESLAESLKATSRGLFADLLRQLSAYLAARALAFAVSGQFVLAGLSAAGSAAASAGAGALAASPTSGRTTFHSGGEIGPNDGWPVPGGRSDERLIIAQTRERVQSRSEVAAGGGGGERTPAPVFVSVTSRSRHKYADEETERAYHTPGSRTRRLFTRSGRRGHSKRRR